MIDRLEHLKSQVVCFASKHQTLKNRASSFQGPQSSSYTCYCAPLLDRVEKKMDRNKREMFKHLDSTHGKLAHRISHLERKTKDQLNSLSNSMKENFAQVRGNKELEHYQYIKTF